jgi:hypothetical protein
LIATTRSVTAAIDLGYAVKIIVAVAVLGMFGLLLTGLATVARRIQRPAPERRDPVCPHCGGTRRRFDADGRPWPCVDTSHGPPGAR